jgi:hypothetical protein
VRHNEGARGGGEAGMPGRNDEGVVDPSRAATLTCVDPRDPEEGV